MAEVSSRLVHQSLQASSQRLENFSRQVGLHLGHLGELAALAEQEQLAEVVAACLEGVKSNLELSHAAQQQARAYAGLRGAYQPAREGTDFEAAYAGELAKQREGDSYDAGGDRQFQDLRRTVWEVHHPGQPLPGEEPIEEEGEDLVEQRPAGAALALNQKCPLTGLPVTDLIDPVQDSKGYVYERAPVERWIKAKQGEDGRAQPGSDPPVTSPVAGVGLYLTLGCLVPADAVLREKRRLERQKERNRGRRAPGGGAGPSRDIDMLEL